MAAAASPVEALRVFFETYTPADKDWAFQLWLDAWAEAARRPAVQATSRRLNLEWQALLERTIADGVAAGAFVVPGSPRRGVADPVAARRAGAAGRRPRHDDLAQPTSWPGRRLPRNGSWFMPGRSVAPDRGNDGQLSAESDPARDQSAGCGRPRPAPPGA